jgi:predicted protein tyrosine phosphatase
MLLTTDIQPEGFLSVKSLKEARSEWGGYDCVVTIEDADFEDGLRVPASFRTRHHVFRFDDTDLPTGHGRAPSMADVKAILMIGRDNRGKKLLVHCLQGQSRSAGAALGIIADRLGPGREAEAVSILMRIRPTAVCNALVVEHVDTLLQRGGAIRDAWNSQLATNDKAQGVMLLRRLAESQNG